MNVYPGDMRFNDFIPGVFLVAKSDGDTREAIFLGESDNVDVCLQKHEKKEEFDKSGANRILFFRAANPKTRSKVVGDLLPELNPTCN
jgi:hypothetical protein